MTKVSFHNLGYIKDLERKYRLEDFTPLNDDFILVKGELPILISASHSVSHFREGKEKFGEYMAGVLATVLGEKLNCSVITKVKNDLTDPNYDNEHPYKDECVNFIKENNIQLVFDLHIMSDKREANIEIGTGLGRNVNFNNTYKDVLKLNLEKNNLSPVIVDELFSALNKSTVSAFVSRLSNVPCVQLEINWRLLNFHSGDFNFDGLVRSLEESVLSLIK